MSLQLTVYLRDAITALKELLPESDGHLWRQSTGIVSLQKATLALLLQPLE